MLFFAGRDDLMKRLQCGFGVILDARGRRMKKRVMLSHNVPQLVRLCARTPSNARAGPETTRVQG